MNKKNKGLYIIFILITIIALGIGVFFLVYKFNNNLYIKLNKKDLLVDRYVIGRNVIETDDSIVNASNIIESNLEKTFNIYFTIPKDGSSDAKFIKSGSASVEYTIKEKSLVLKIINLISIEEGEYTSELEQKEYVMTFSGEKIKNGTYNNSFFYILTENGNIYRYRMERDGSTIMFENSLFNFTGNNDDKFNKSDVLFANGKSVYVDFKAKELVEYNNKIYALTDDGKYMSLSPVSYYDYKNLEYDYINISDTFRFYNHLLIFNNKSNARHCTKYLINECDENNTYDLIKDNTGNVITISAVIEVNDSIYLIDTKGNLYFEKYDRNNTNIVIETVSKHVENRVVEIVYFYKSSEPAKLEKLAILFDNGTRLELDKDIFRGNILISEKSKL